MLENLAKVIRKTNEGAADVIAVPIKRIDSLDVAQWAINDAVRESPKVYVDKNATDAGALPGQANSQPSEVPPDAAEREKALDDELLDRALSRRHRPTARARRPGAVRRVQVDVSSA